MKQRISIGWLVLLFINLQTSTCPQNQTGTGHLERKTTSDFSFKPIRQQIKSSSLVHRHNDFEDSINKILAPVQPRIQKIKESVSINLKVNCSSDIINRLIAELSNISNVLDTIQISTIPDDLKRLISGSISEFNRFAMVTCINVFHLTKEQQYLELAFRFAEKTKFRILSETMAFKLAMRVSGIPEEMVRKEYDLSLSIHRVQNEISGKSFISNMESDNTLVQLTSKLNLLYKEKKNLLSDLDKKQPLFRQLRFKPYSTDVKSIQKALTEDQVILDYVSGPMNNILQPRKSEGHTLILEAVHLYCFIISKRDFLLQEINDSSSFISTLGVNSFVSKIDAKGGGGSITGYQNFVRKSHQLYLLLIEPIRSKITGQSLLISPDRQLIGLPFDILISDLPESLTGFDFKSLNYLMKENAISYIFTPGITFQQQKKVQKLHSILAFAPTYKNKKEFKEEFTGPGIIQDSQDSVLSLDSIELQEPIKTKETCTFLKSEYNGLAFIDDSATKHNFLTYAAQFDILHLAMHGQKNEANTDESDMIFTPLCNDTDFLFCNYEISSLPLKAGLIVLQSCQSGSEAEDASERFQSPVRNFFIAGVPLGIASSWNLDDSASGEIFQSFYRYFFQGYRADQALRKAKLDFLKKSNQFYSQPYLWAACQCFGNPEAIQAETSNQNIWKWIIPGILTFLLTTFFIVRFVRKKVTHNQGITS